MRKASLTVALLAGTLTGCATSPSCFVGLSLIPPMPVIYCGVDTEPASTEKEEPDV